jgi:outer membrane immunogenic protein
MLWANWMVRFEYRYANFGTISNTDLRTCPTGCGAPFTETVGYDVKLQTHTATFGFAYKFGDPLVASAAAPLVYKYRNLYNYSGPWSDPAAASAVSWTGPYLGAGIGVRATTTTANLDSATAPLPGGPFDLVAAACNNKFGTGCFLGEALNGTAFLFNAYAGFNWQFATSWVGGIEGDFGLANQKRHSPEILLRDRQTSLPPTARRTIHSASAQRGMQACAAGSVIWSIRHF